MCEQLLKHCELANVNDRTTSPQKGTRASRTALEKTNQISNASPLAAAAGCARDLLGAAFVAAGAAGRVLAALAGRFDFAADWVSASDCAAAAGLDAALPNATRACCGLLDVVPPLPLTLVFGFFLPTFFFLRTLAPVAAFALRGRGCSEGCDDEPASCLPRGAAAVASCDCDLVCTLPRVSARLLACDASSCASCSPSS